jgi:hypothetical protein
MLEADCADAETTYLRLKEEAKEAKEAFDTRVGILRDAIADDPNQLDLPLADASLPANPEDDQTSVSIQGPDGKVHELGTLKEANDTFKKIGRRRFPR